MGFLRKDWDWENPASHDMEQPEERKDRKLWLWVLAFACFGLSVYVMYHTEKTIYGGAIQANSIGYAVALLTSGIVLVWRKAEETWGEEKEKKPRKEPSKWGEWAGRLALAVAVGFLVWWCVKERDFRIIGLQTLCVLPLPFAIEWKKKQENANETELEAWSMLFGFAILVAVTLIAPRAMGISTVAEAEKLLAEQGYTNVEYNEAIEGTWLNVVLETVPPMTKEERKDLMVYLFQGKKDGTDWGIIIDPWSGSIMDAEEVAYGSALYHWLE